MTFFRTSRRFGRAMAAAITLTGAVLGIASHPALSRTEFQPTDITTPNPIVPGSPLECDVTLTGGPANVTIYSDPPGAVSYSGPVSGSSAVIEATTSSSASGTVTVYAITDGSTTVATAAPVDLVPPGGCGCIR